MTAKPPTMDDAIVMLEGTANVLRGMALDPSIPEHARGVLRSRAEKIDVLTEAHTEAEEGEVA